MKKHTDLAFKSIQIWFLNLQEVFYEKTVNNFLNSEQKIIYAKKKVNNFLNNVEQKIILCRMLEIILCYLFLCLCLFVDYPKKKKIVRISSLVSSSTLEKQVPYYKELEFTKLEYHIFFFIAQIPGQQHHGGMKLGTRVY